ncbi:HAD family hydrolase [Puniceicoccus vermicola]|uniref:Haloacid dehalogenase-like hydrolase n=1 Tax=Puniceicoccus vermicola TaxID=388746 RepID=A0A7X1E5G0_9BACT|nr:HAD family hydrolase [Puniceicoccus vermicola]MBC2601567.1 haloacid dehalogenase-like hydrolase [Puniceicoccus vermicola]
MKIADKTITSLLPILLVASALRADPLPSWEETPAKTEIIQFVESTTDPESDSYVPPAERIATFDNDGTLWSEQPMYSQLFFIFDRVNELAPKHPDWKTQEPFASVLKGDYAKALSGGDKAIMELVAATSSGMTSEEYSDAVRDWIKTAKNPEKKMLYTDMVFQPMLELLTYLRAEGYKTYIVSGGGIDFMRVFAEEVYGIPPEQVVGSELQAKFAMQDGVPVMIKESSLDFIDDKAGKPLGIYQHIGRRPIFAAGNSDGDMQMLQYTTVRRSSDDDLPRFGLLVHHDDADREWAYDRDSHFGKLDKALDAASDNDWLVVSMKDDWVSIYPAASSASSKE